MSEYNYFWGKIFLYCVEHRIKISELIRYLMIEIQPYVEAYEERFLLFNRNAIKHPENHTIFHISMLTAEIEMNLISAFLKVPVMDILNQGDYEKRVVAFCKRHLLFNNNYNVSFSEPEFTCECEGTYYYEIDDDAEEEDFFTIGKYLNKDTFQINYYISIGYPSGTEDYRRYNLPGNIDFPQIATEMVIGREFDLYSATEGMFADYVDFELDRRAKRNDRVLDFKDVIVKTNLRRCDKENHSIKIMDGIVFVYKNSSQEIHSVTIPVTYCNDCNAYFISWDDYDKLERSGTILCRVIGHKEWREQSYVSFKGLSSESIFKLCGYNVNAIDDIPDSGRQCILKFMIRRNIVTVQKTLNYLMWLVNTHKKDNKYMYAIAKWERDVEFIKKEYHSG